MAYQTSKAVEQLQRTARSLWTVGVRRKKKTTKTNQHSSPTALRGSSSWERKAQGDLTRRCGPIPKVWSGKLLGTRRSPTC